MSARPTATPLPLGFLALAVTSILVSGLELSWVSRAGQGHTVALLVLVFVVPLQAAGGVLGFLTRAPAEGTGMAVLAGTWAAYGAGTLLSPPGATSRGLGLLLCGSAVALLVPAAASALDKPLATAVLVCAAARFAVSGSYELTASTGASHAAGWIGLVVSAVAAYAALAFEFEGVTGHAVLPVGRISPPEELNASRPAG